MRLAGEERWIDADDAGLYRDALGAVPPGGLPAAFLEDVPDALARLVRRYARDARPVHGRRPARAVRRRLRRGAGASSSAPATSSAASCGPAAREREWCDPEVLRRLRRASLAALRKEVEPVDPRALARFLPAWQGVDRHPATGAGVDRLREVLVPLQGLALPAEVWERDVLPRRAGAYSPAWIDQLCASGELVWIGAGALGRSSGRVALYFREDLPLLGPPAGPRGAVASESPAHDAGCARGWPPARASSPTCSSTSTSRPRSSRRRCGIWCGPGEVTNDAFAPLRAPRLTLARAQRERARSAARPGRFASRRRGAGASAQVQGRWSLTESLFRAAVDPAARRRALAELLLERYGILTREQVRAEGVPGGFSAIYPELSQLETLGSRGAATSSRGSAALSSRSPARSSGCARSEADDETAGRARRRRPGPALRRGAGVAGEHRVAARRRASRAHTWCWPPASRSSTSSAAGARCRRSSTPDDPRLEPALDRARRAVRGGRVQAPGAREGRRRARARLAARRGAGEARVPGRAAAADAQCVDWP